MVVKLNDFGFRKDSPLRSIFMGMSREPVHDGVGQGRFSYVLNPFAHWQFGGDERGPFGEAVLQNLQQAEPQGMVQGPQTVVIEHKHPPPL